MRKFLLKKPSILPGFNICFGLGASYVCFLVLLPLAALGAFSFKGGIGEILSAFLQENEISDVKIVSFEFADIFLPHGKTADVERSLGLDVKTLVERILSDKK